MAAATAAEKAPGAESTATSPASDGAIRPTDRFLQTVIVIPDTPNPSANIGTATGTIGLTVGGEQSLLAQGSLVADGSKYYLDGKLLFGVDYEGEVGFGEKAVNQSCRGP